MYNFIAAEEKYLDQMVPLIASTGYWDAGLRSNTLNLPTHEFIREYVAKPILPFTTIAVPDEDCNTALGLLTCGPLKELESSMFDYGDYISNKVKLLFANLFAFDIPNSYHIPFVAVNKLYRGHGIGIKLMQLAEDKWLKTQMDTLSLYVFSCQTSAIKLYLKMGMMITHVLEVDYAVPCPCLLYFEKNSKTEALHNYFETSKYQEFSF